MARFRFIVFLMMTFFVGLTFATENNQIYQFKNSTTKKQFTQLTHELRCLVCQNQNIAESNAGLAVDLRREIANKLHDGWTKKRILDYLVHRYGEYILYKPPVNQATWLLWFGPFILLVFGLICLFTAIIIMRKRQPVETLSNSDRETLEQFLGDENK